MIIGKSPIADRTWIADKIGGVDSNLWNMKYDIWYMCLNETDWKLTDEITYFFQSHLQFPGFNFLKVLVDFILNY